MHLAQAAQGFHQLEFGRCQLGKVEIAIQHMVELLLLLMGLAGEQHPQVLHRRAIAAVVEIDEVGAVVGPQDITRMAIAVQPNFLVRAGGKALLQQLD